MDQEKNNNIKDNILEISNLVYVLKMALLNNEQENNDTQPYGYFISVIENKINSFYEMFEKMN